MKARVERWGDSLAVRIPRPFAIESRIDQGTVVEVSLVDGTLVLTPLAEVSPTLEELLAGVTPENLHGEIDFGPPVGKEVW